MSCRIEYQWACFAITWELCPQLNEPRFVVAVEGGCSNLFEAQASTGRPRRVRGWGIGMIGTHRQVLRYATHVAAACEGGSLKPGGRACTPEAYIARVRRLMAHAHEAGAAERHIALATEVPADHPLAQAERVDGFTYYESGQLQDSRVKLIPRGTDQWARYFNLIDPFLDDLSLHPSNTGVVWGLPRS